MIKNNSQKNENGHSGRSSLTYAILAVVLMVMSALAVAFTKVPPLITVIVATVMYCAASALLYIFSELKKDDIPDELNPIVRPVLLEAFEKMDSPVFICNSAEKLTWYNGATDKLLGGEKLYGKSVSDVFGISLAQMRKNIGREGTRFSCRGRSFKVQYYHTRRDDRDFSLIVTTEMTEYDSLASRMHGEEMAVGYIMIDNLGEMIQYDTEHYRPAAMKIDEILRGWAEEYGALLREYERDKYLLITQSKEIERMISEKFDILDRVRSVKAGETNLPLTISMGVSSTAGTYAEKEKAAHAALDMALQRGGDQAVVKTDDSTEYYGGVTKTVQKRTNVRARVVSNELMSEMKSASNVLIMGHKKADFDAFGACVGLARIAMACGARVNIVIDKADRNLIGCRELISENGDYLGLFVSAAEGLDMLETGTLVVVCDVNNLDIAEEPELAHRAEKLAVIDHHRKMNEFSRDVDLEYIEPSASSACELVAEMLEQVLPKDELSASEANIILAGITLDTKQFTKNTGTRTFSAALYLRDRGADPLLIKGLFKESFEDYRREVLFRQNVEIHRGIYAITTVGERSDGESLDRTIAAKAADNLLMVDGIKASFALIVEGDTVHISARSAGDVNVEVIMKKLGGGGHFDGAGVQCKGKSVDEVVAELKEAIDSRDAE